MIEKARELIKSHTGIWYIFSEKYICIPQKDIDAILAELETPESGGLTNHIQEQVIYIKEMLNGKHPDEELDWPALLSQVIEACDIIDADKETIRNQAERIKELKKAIIDQLPTTMSLCPVCKKYGVTSRQSKCDKCRIKELEKYCRHKDGCNPKPWENECKCGFLQVLKKGE